jgi:hypothetical protein
MPLEKSRNADLVFVLSKQGKPLMPCSPARARKLLTLKKAKVIQRTPFVIQLLHGSTGYIQEIQAGMDTGSKRIGVAATSQGKVLYQAEIELRQDISSKMQQRSMYRKNRRSRKTRYRPARLNNRGKKGKLAPSVFSKLQSHLREKKTLEALLPVSKWKVELAAFDIHKISDPTVSKKHGWTYQQGRQKDFYNLKAYVLCRDEHTCQQCKKKNLPLQVHHIVFRSEGGTDAPENLITLCHTCHEKLHAGHLGTQITDKLKKKLKSKTKHPTEMGILKSQIKKTGWTFEEAYGFETKFKRETVFQLPKAHFTDAIAICTQEQDSLTLSPFVYYKKHVSKADYQQTCGSRSEQRIPTGKLFGFRKFDLIQTPKGTGFIKGKRSSGYFALTKLDGTKIHDSVNVKTNCIRLQARKTTLIEKGKPQLLSALKDKVSAAGTIG